MTDDRLDRNAKSFKVLNPADNPAQWTDIPMMFMLLAVIRKMEPGDSLLIERTG